MSRLPVEILAPAGTPEALTAAVRAGADAVYLGSGRFNARRNAKNFDETALERAVAYCHARGVAVHLTLNTLVRQDELPAALEVAQTACRLGVDALIVQDIGLARCIRAAAPDMPLHASTQLSCHTPAGVERLRNAGFRRVVLSREMTREEIAACTGRGVEIEAFVHGALCMCVSGQCYLSAMLGGRSGNRGLCAQPCRLPFEPADKARCAENGYALSLKDAALTAYVADMAALGVCSLKIEGRMKRPEYVAAAAAAYAAAARGEAPDEALLADLQAVFSRSGFTDGYYTGKRGSAMFGVRRREDVTAAAPVLGRLQRLYEKETPRVPVTMRLTLRAGQPVTLTVQDGDGREVTVSGGVPETAVNRPLEETRAAAQLSKTGGTPFAAQAVSCAIEPGLTAPLSALNALRREALEQLEQRRGVRAPIAFDPIRLPAMPPAVRTGDFPAHTGSPLRIARVAAAAQLPAEADKLADIWILPPDAGEQPVSLPLWGVEILRGMFGREERLREQLREAKAAGAAYALCGNVGAIPLALEAGLKPIGGFGLNLTNAQALAEAADWGLAAATLSFELTFRQMAFARVAALPTGVFVYGRQPLMLTRNCPRQAAVGCAGCEGQGRLVDRKGVMFPLACAGGCTELLNSACLYWADRLDELPQTDFWLLHFTEETPEQVAQTLRDYRCGGAPRTGITRGLYLRGVE